MSQMTEHIVLLYPCVAEEAPPKSRGNHPGRIVPAALSYQSPVKELALAEYKSTVGGLDSSFLHISNFELFNRTGLEGQ